MTRYDRGSVRTHDEKRSVRMFRSPIGNAEHGVITAFRCSNPEMITHLGTGNVFAGRGSALETGIQL